MSQASAEPGTQENPFTKRIPITPEVDEIFRGLATSWWRVHLARLYMRQGRYLPEEAKRLGVVFWYCDARGVARDRATASCVGWSIAAAGE